MFDYICHILYLWSTPVFYVTGLFLAIAAWNSHPITGDLGVLFLVINIGKFLLERKYEG